MSTYYACAPSDTTHVHVPGLHRIDPWVFAVPAGEDSDGAPANREKERERGGGGKGEREEEGEVGGGRGRTRHVRTRNARRSSGHNSESAGFDDKSHMASSRWCMRVRIQYLFALTALYLLNHHICYRP